jgi:hypothetical protein
VDFFFLLVTLTATRHVPGEIATTLALDTRQTLAVLDAIVTFPPFGTVIFNCLRIEA